MKIYLDILVVEQLLKIGKKIANKYSDSKQAGVLSTHVMKPIENYLKTLWKLQILDKNMDYF